MTETPVPNVAVLVSGCAGWVRRGCDGTGASGGAAGLVDVREDVPGDLGLADAPGPRVAAAEGDALVGTGVPGVVTVGVAVEVADDVAGEVAGVVAGAASSEPELQAATGVSSAASSSPAPAR